MDQGCLETKNESNSKKDEIILAVQTKDKAVQFKGEDLKLEVKILDKKFKPTWKQIKECFKEIVRKKRLVWL